MYRSSIYPAKDNSDHLSGQAGKENARSGPGVARYRNRQRIGPGKCYLSGFGNRKSGGLKRPASQKSQGEGTDELRRQAGGHKR
jgi:hypothetical protein